MSWDTTKIRKREEATEQVGLASIRIKSIPTFSCFIWRGLLLNACLKHHCIEKNTSEPIRPIDLYYELTLCSMLCVLRVGPRQYTARGWGRE